jgi:hypothetical protein
MDLREIWWEIVDWIHQIHDRDQWRGCYEHGNEPSVSIRGRKFVGKLSSY